jgi:hypothetical protein
VRLSEFDGQDGVLISGMPAAASTPATPATGPDNGTVSGR